MPVAPLALEIPEGLAEVLVAHAKVEAPREACGLIGVADGRLIDYVPAENAAPEEARFSMRFSPGTLSPSGEAGMFHSHVEGDAVPSSTDVREILAGSWRGCPCLIFSLRTGRFGAWRIT